MSKWIFWDFDGTLAQRQGMFSSALYKALIGAVPGTNLTREDLAKHLRSGFPWHEPDKSHEHLNNSSALWWSELEKVFINCYVSCEMDYELSSVLAKEAHQIYIDPAGFQLFEDTIETLEHFAHAGWKQAIFSNHVPELTDIVHYHELDKYIDVVVNSAKIGFEKPNRRFFEKALDIIGEIDDCWMIGDSIVSDVKGPGALGIKSILVRTNRTDEVEHYAATLRELKDIIK